MIDLRRASSAAFRMAEVEALVTEGDKSTIMGEILA
jgi:hypothetical protein